jgi:ERCC4-type nuclease
MRVVQLLLVPYLRIDNAIDIIALEVLITIFGGNRMATTPLAQIADGTPVDQLSVPAETGSQPLHICVDMRERQSPVPELLAAFGDVSLTFAALPSADYVLSETVAVERKTTSDFVASILDRRLFSQATKMQLLFARPLMIVEGDLTQVPHSIDLEAIRGALAFVTVRAEITVLQVGEPSETAAMLRLLARHAQERLDLPISLREPKPLVEQLYAAYLVEGLPGSARAVRASCWRTLVRRLRSCAHPPKSLPRCWGSGRKARCESGKLSILSIARTRHDGSLCYRA